MFLSQEFYLHFSQLVTIELYFANSILKFRFLPLTSVKFEIFHPDEIKRAINELDWDHEFAFLSLDERVILLSNYILNIFTNLVPNKTITIKDRDALWMTPDINKGSHILY